MRDFAHLNVYSAIFGFLKSSTAKTRARITENTSKYAVSCKDVPFGGRKNKTLDPRSPQSRQFRVRFQRDFYVPRYAHASRGKNKEMIF